MRQSERRKYRDQLQDHQQQYQDQPSFHRQNRNPNKGHRNRTETTQPSNINDKYGRKKKDIFLAILTPSQETTSKREDYNVRQYPRESDGRSQRSNKTQPQKNAYRRKEGQYIKTKEELDEEIEAYKRQAGHRSKAIEKEEKVQRREEEEQDLSFHELKQERNRGKQYKNKASFEPIKKRQREKKENNDSEEWIVAASRREEKPIERKPQQKIQQPSRPKQQSKRQYSSNRSLNQAFNEVSKESINQSSNWLDQKILDGLDEDESSQQDILSNTDSSYVSQIPGNSRLHHDFNSSHLSYSEHNSVLNEESTFQNILQTIQNSKDLQTRQMQLQVTSVKNILEIVVKEVCVRKLGMNVKLSLKQEEIVVKNNGVDLQTLKEYISFEQIKVSHPRVIHDSPIVSTFTLCKLKIPSSNQDQSKNSSKFIKKEKKQSNPNEQNNCRQLLRVVKLQLKCMNCQKCSEVTVLELTNQASLSCPKCGEQMISKLTKLSLQ